MNRVGGWKPDKHDARDRDFAIVRQRLAAKVGVFHDEWSIESLTPISDQGGLQSCVANATCDALEMLSKHSPVQLSRLFAYWNARRIDRETDRDEGTYIRNAFSSLKSIGVCPESQWPYDESRVAVQPHVYCYEQGYDHRVSAFYRITSMGHDRLADIETAVRAGHPVVFGTDVGQSFADFDGSGSIVWHAPSRSIGGHAMVIMGVRRNTIGELHFMLRNSWGTSWGEQGYAWAAADWIADPVSSDFWVPTAPSPFDEVT